MPAYLDRGLDYRALCVPHWLQKERELFHGFWGAAFNEYRDATPHAGYDILRRWRETVFPGKVRTRVCMRESAPRSVSTWHLTDSLPFAFHFL